MGFAGIALAAMRHGIAGQLWASDPKSGGWRFAAARQPMFQACSCADSTNCTH